MISLPKNNESSWFEMHAYVKCYGESDTHICLNGKREGYLMSPHLPFSNISSKIDETDFLVYQGKTKVD